MEDTASDTLGRVLFFNGFEIGGGKASSALFLNASIEVAFIATADCMDSSLSHIFLIMAAPKNTSTNEKNQSTRNRDPPNKENRVLHTQKDIRMEIIQANRFRRENILYS